MECGGDDVVVMDPRAPQQEIVGGVRVYDVACHHRLEISNLALELYLAEWSRAVGVEAENCRLSRIQPTGWDLQELHDPARHDAESRPGVHLDTVHLN